MRTRTAPAEGTTDAHMISNTLPREYSLVGLLIRGYSLVGLLMRGYSLVGLTAFDTQFINVALTVPQSSLHE